MKSQRIKEKMKKMFCLPPIPASMVAVPSFIIVVYVLTGNIQNIFIADISYVMASYALVITVIWAVKILYWIRSRIMDIPLVKKILGHPLYEKYIKRIIFRVKLSLYQGLFINSLYAGTKFFSGIYYHSVWLVMLAVYYVLLVVMRVFLLAFVRNTKETGREQALEWKKYRQCGIALLFMNQVLMGIVVFVVVKNRSFEYRGVLIYAMALYSFYAVIISIRNMVKVRRYASPVMSAARVINMTAALVSLLSLETALLARFGEPGQTVFRQVMVSITGGGICIVVLGMAVFMIVRATLQLKHFGL